jgi:muramoyltetrapeptide carboxypeptidase LdcA involved in peptidoglycan recycling
MNGNTIPKVCFIAPSTCLPRGQKGALDGAIRLLKKGVGVDSVYLSPFVFSSDEQIDHVTASAEARSEHFKKVIREQDLIFSVAGGTGAEDLAPKIDAKDYAVIRERRPVFVGFSDFTFLINEIYFHTRVPAVYFPSLRLGKGNFRKVLSLIMGEEVQYQGAAWLTPPPARKFSGIPIGGNLTTFVNYLNRKDPPKFNWKRYILFIEDIQIDVEDLHRLLAALRRHRVFKDIRAVVIGSLNTRARNHNSRKEKKEALKFVRTYLDDVIRQRRKAGRPMPILAVANFGHDIERNLLAVPVGGYVSISKSRKIVVRMHKPRRPPAA